MTVPDDARRADLEARVRETREAEQAARAEFLELFERKAPPGGWTKEQRLMAYFGPQREVTK